MFGALEPPEAEEEEEEATAGTRPRAPGKSPTWARRAAQAAAGWPAWRPTGSRAHNRAQRGKDIEAAGPKRDWLKQRRDTAVNSDAHRQRLVLGKTQREQESCPGKNPTNKEKVIP